MDVRHQVVVWADGAAATAAKPRVVRLFSETAMADFNGLRFGQFLFRRVIPRIRLGRRIANLIDKPQKKDDRQTAEGDFRDEHF